jgi:large subunit ribosomal protein L9
MQVLLLKKTTALGDDGDIVSVSDGFARNYLFPKKLAVKADKGTIELQKKLIAERQKRSAQELEQYRVLAEKISALSLTVPVKVGEDDQLYGSVTTSDIVRLAKEEGIEIDKKHILLESPIKNLGVYAIEVLLHPEVKAAMKLWVVKE